MAENIDLEKKRDEKCIPLARVILSDMVESLIPEDANKVVDFNPLVLKILSRMLEADTNITTENPYVFQLLLGAFTGLNRTVQESTTVMIDDVRYGRIAKKILEILSEANVKLGDIKPEESAIDFSVVKTEINKLFADEKLNMLEVKYVMDNIFDSFKTVTDLFNSSVEKSGETAEAKLFGVENMSDLSMKQLDDVLKK